MKYAKRFPLISELPYGDETPFRVWFMDEYGRCVRAHNDNDRPWKYGLGMPDLNRPETPPPPPVLRLRLRRRRPANDNRKPR